MAVTESEHVRQVTAWPERPPVTVQRGSGAPFGWWPAVCIALVAAIDRIEYNLLAGALPTIQKEFGFAGAIANLTAANADVVAASRRGLGFAVLQMLVTLGGALGPWLIGLASDSTGSLRWAYTVVLLPLVTGSLIVLGGQRTYRSDAAAALGGPDVR